MDRREKAASIKYCRHILHTNRPAIYLQLVKEEWAIWWRIQALAVSTLPRLILYIYCTICWKLLFESSRHYQLKGPKMGFKRRQYYICIDANFLIQYGYTLPYRTCGIAQSRHPGERALSATEVLSLLILAIDCHKKSPDQPSYTVNR